MAAPPGGSSGPSRSQVQGQLRVETSLHGDPLLSRRGRLLGRIPPRGHHTGPRAAVRLAFPSSTGGARQGPDRRPTRQRSAPFRRAHLRRRLRRLPHPRAADPAAAQVAHHHVSRGQDAAGRRRGAPRGCARPSTRRRPSCPTEDVLELATKAWSSAATAGPTTTFASSARRSASETSGRAVSCSRTCCASRCPCWPTRTASTPSTYVAPQPAPATGRRRPCPRVVRGFQAAQLPSRGWGSTGTTR